jgi:ubiquinone/menaquinone biosynthesis C-methylase UbiE
MTTKTNYLDVNRTSWNARTSHHVSSEFYDVKGFLEGKTSLKSIELDLLGDVKGKSILHLQCHFGQDTISLARLGAHCTGVDLSDKAIEEAEKLAEKANVEASFICSDVYDLPNHLESQFDIVYTSYGVIGWLPDLDAWANVISKFLKPSGKLIVVEFHPVVWMFDDDFKAIKYSYFNKGEIVETETGTYAQKDADITNDFVIWNHSLSDVVNNLIKNGLQLNTLNEYDYSPYDCFNNTIEFESEKFRIQNLEEQLPMVFAIKATKS